MQGVRGQKRTAPKTFDVGIALYAGMAAGGGGRTLVISAPDDAARVEWVESIELARMTCRNAAVSAVCEVLFPQCSFAHSVLMCFVCVARCCPQERARKEKSSPESRARINLSL